MTRLELDYRAWRQTPQAEVVMDAYRRLAKERADRGFTFNMIWLAKGGVQYELSISRIADLGAPKYKVYDAFLECIGQDLIREMPELEPFLKPPARRPGGRNARASGALLRGGG
jgi:hypothetical protein